MQARNPDAFAMKNSGLDAFLYADVGAELNGSTLTVLSMLARLGTDPWAEAARWATLPRATVIDSLAESIAKMPLASPALGATRAIAARLVQLLPAKTQNGQGHAAGTQTPWAAPRWLILCCALLAGMALNMLLARTQPGAPPSEPALAAAVQGDGGR
jgi:hypothetical protein